MGISLDNRKKIKKLSSIIDLYVTVYDYNFNELSIKGLRKQPFTRALLPLDEEKPLTIQYGNFQEIWLVFPLEDCFVSIGPIHHLQKQNILKIVDKSEKHYVQNIPVYSSDHLRNLLAIIDNLFSLNLENYYTRFLQGKIINNKIHFEKPLTKETLDSYKKNFCLEHRLMKLMSTGDPYALQQLVQEIPLGILPIPNTSSIREEKNYCILLMEKLSWFVIQMGGDVMDSLALRNFYVKEIEGQETLLDILTTRDSAIIHFTESLQEIHVKSYSTFIHQVIQYIGFHIYDATILSDIENHFYVSNTHLRRRFKKEVGITIGSYIQQQKILVAKCLLLSQMPPSKVVKELHYHDTSHFSKIFKKHTGLTPLQFQKKNRCSTEMQ